MAFTKIVDSDLTDIGVIGLPDRPGLSTSAMQAKLEETARSVIIPKHNGLINELEATTGAASLGMQTPTGFTGATVQTVVDDIAEKVMQLDPESLSSKADKVTSAVEGNFAGLDSEGNLTDSGNKAADFAAASHTHTKSEITDFPTLATVATTGSYADLSGQPTLGTASALDVPASGNASSSQVVKGNDSRLSDDRNAADVYSWAKQSTKPSYTASEVGAIASTEKGANGGVAELDNSGKVPSSQLPSYVDDVLEYASLSDFPATGETGKIYIAKDTNKTYRWSGTAYVEISESLALGETSSTAYAGNKGKANADAISAIKDGATIDSFGDVETALADKISKSATSGLVKNDGTIDTTTYVSDISGKADKVSSATSGNFAGLDSNGNLTDSGSKASDFLTQHQDISGKQDKTLSAQVEGQSTVEGALGALSDADKATRQLIDDTVGWITHKWDDISDPKQYGAGATWSVSGNSISINGTETYSGVYYEIELPNDTYKFSCTATITGGTYKQITVYDSDNSTALANTGEFNASAKKELTFTVTHNKVYLRVYASRGSAGSMTLSDVLIINHASVEETIPQVVSDTVGWTGKNEQQLDNYTTKTGVDIANNGFINTSTDSATTFDFTLWCKRADTTNISIISQNYSSTGHKELRVSIPKDTAMITIGHHADGSSVYLAVRMPFDGSVGDYIVSFDLDGYNPSVVGGLVVKNLKLVHITVKEALNDKVGWDVAVDSVKRNWFDYDKASSIVTGDNTTITKTETGVNVSSTGSSTYRQAFVIFNNLSILKNKNVTLTTDVVVASGAGGIEIAYSDDGETFNALDGGASGNIPSNKSVSLTVNMGNHLYYRFRFRCTAGTATSGNVSYNNLVFWNIYDNTELDTKKADNSVIAPVENDTTVQKSGGYAVGSHAIRNGAFITWKNAKAQGETINDASDYDSGDVADAVADIKTGVATVDTGHSSNINLVDASTYNKVLRQGNIVVIKVRIQVVADISASDGYALIKLPYIPINSYPYIDIRYRNEPYSIACGAFIYNDGRVSIKSALPAGIYDVQGVYVCL